MGKTLDQARDFWKRVDSPNLMIKIPERPRVCRTSRRRSTRASTSTSRCCSPSTATRTSQRPTSRASSAAMPRASRSTCTRSPASSFRALTRWSTSSWTTRVTPDLKGKAAVANARAAYTKFKEIFYGERFATLREAGAPVQRPLWASTGTKNPEYSEVLYVDTLAGPGNRQHDADEDDAGRRRAERSHRRHARRRPATGAHRTCRRGNRHARRSRSNCSTKASMHSSTRWTG